MMLYSVPGILMRTTLALDDDLVRMAQEFTGVAEKTALIREALKALIERESARRLASLGGTMPKLKGVPRRRIPMSKIRMSKVRMNKVRPN
jgi:Arc/MetJ family transcription regulator